MVYRRGNGPPGCTTRRESRSKLEPTAVRQAERLKMSQNESTRIRVGAPGRTTQTYDGLEIGKSAHSIEFTLDLLDLNVLEYE